MESLIYLTPIDPEKIIGSQYEPNTLADSVKIYNGHEHSIQDISKGDIVILGVEEDRLSWNKGSEEAPDRVRSYLYKLHKRDDFPSIFDLGNIASGDEVKDTYFALSSVLTELLRNGNIPVVIGGTHDLTYPMYTAYEKLETMLNLVIADAEFDLGNAEEEINANGYLNKIILHDPNFLFNFSNIGYQTYFIDKEINDLMERLYFDIYRLGELRENMKRTEPVIRDADLFSFDISCIRASDALGNKKASPNGFFGDEACQMARYAGMSDKLSSFGIFETNPLVDHQGVTQHLVAQIIWHFIEGIKNRKNDLPIGEKNEFTKYIVDIDESKFQLIFYKSKKTDRWWIDVPYPPNKKTRYERHHIIPCSYEDYLIATDEEIPDKWWKTYQKLS
ncbi:MAG: formimidoylglutamase [Flavobacteriales bacterium]